MLCVVSEDTERVIGERRMATLRDLGSDPSVVRDRAGDAGLRRPPARAATCSDLPFTLTYLFDDDGAHGWPARAGSQPGIRRRPRRWRPEPALWPVDGAARGESALVDLDGGRSPDLPTGDWPEPPTQALVVPLLRQGGVPVGSWSPR